MTKTRILRPADIVLIGLIVAASLLMLRMRPTQAGAAAEIYRDGERCAVIDLRDPARQEFQFDGAIPVTIISENGAICLNPPTAPTRSASAPASCRARANPPRVYRRVW